MTYLITFYRLYIHMDSLTLFFCLSQAFVKDSHTLLLDNLNNFGMSAF